MNADDAMAFTMAALSTASWNDKMMNRASVASPRWKRYWLTSSLNLQSIKVNRRSLRL